MQNLTIQQVLKATRKALANKTIQAQSAHKDPALAGACRYQTIVDGKEYNCVIGCALSKDTKDKIVENGEANWTGIEDIATSNEFFNVKSVNHLNDMIELQEAHDKWVAPVLSEERKKRARKFYRVLKKFETKYNINR